MRSIWRNVAVSYKFMTCRDCLCPVVLTRGTDQMPLSTKFEMRSDAGVIHSYGRMLVELSATIPDGIVCFFVSYLYMDQIVAKWHDMGILQVCQCLSLFASLRA